MKKILCILLSLISFVCFVNAEDITITEVSLGLPTPPAVGNPIIFDYTIPDTPAYSKSVQNDGKLFVKIVGQGGDVTAGNYGPGEAYKWATVVCPNDGYVFPSKTEDVTFIVNGFDITDKTIVASTQKTVNATTCRGLEITFQPLPGTANQFLTGPSYSNSFNVNESQSLSFTFSTNATIVLQKQANNTWVDLDTYVVTGNQLYSFVVPTETTPKSILYRLRFFDGSIEKVKEFRIDWINPNNLIDEITIQFPTNPVLGEPIIDEYDIPENVDYEKSNWNEGKLFITGDVSTGKYVAGEYKWSAVVCPKEDYSFVQSNNDITFNISGIDLDDKNIVKSYTKTYNSGTTCRGFEIKFVEMYDVEQPVVTLSANNNSVTLTWDEQPGADNFRVYRSLNNKKWSKILTTEETAINDTGLTYGKTYYYLVRACNVKGCSAYSNVVSKKIKPNKTIVTIVSAGTENIKLSWDRIKVTGYQIARSTDNKKWTTIKTITKNSILEYNNKSLKANKTYYYKVRAYKTVSGKKIYGSWSTVVYTKTAPVKPTLEVKLKDYDSMKLVIGEVKGASEYRVYRSLDNKNWERIETLPVAGTLVDASHEVGTRYYYKVKACNKYGYCSGYRRVDLLQTTRTPKLTLESKKAKKVKISVSEVNGADGYKVYRATSRYGKYTLINDIKDLELIFNDKTKSGYTYYYKVRSYKYVDGKKVHSPYSSIKYIRSK